MNEYLSIQTRNRLFGLIRNDFKPAASYVTAMEGVAGGLFTFKGTGTGVEQGVSDRFET